MNRCHTGYRDWSLRCHGYCGTPDRTKYPELSPNCTTVRWENANASNNWGNCFEMRTDDRFRLITANNVPDFYMNLYCPIGVGYGYCVKQEIESGTCMFPDLVCGEDNGPGYFLLAFYFSTIYFTNSQIFRIKKTGVSKRVLDSSPFPLDIISIFKAYYNHNKLINPRVKALRRRVDTSSVTL